MYKICHWVFFFVVSGLKGGVMLWKAPIFPYIVLFL